ncbi:MAG: hypothetical protein REI45_04790 [Propionicimonas sp.]|nr:hypothetical protein [Propionicimonas sp.]
MRQAVIFGAGSVGRGFLGQLLCDAGWQVTFLDVDPVVVSALARDGEYPHVTLGEGFAERRTVGPVTALDARDTAAAVRALEAADLAATSVGGRVLPAVADTLAEALRERIAAGRPALNVLLAENVHDCAAVMRGLLAERLPELPAATLAANLGLLETSIGRMIPVPDPALRATEPTLVRVEPYRLLPYDAAAVVGQPLDVPGLVADLSVPFSFYGDRKLYIHNMGHCLTACLGRLLGLELVWQAVGRVELRYLARAAMTEAALALAERYRVDPGPLLDHIDDLLYRFGNRALADTTERVGRDLERKLAPADRLLGAYRLAAGQGLPTRYLSLAIATAGALLVREDGWDAGRLWAHLDDGLAGLLDGDRRALLAAQLDGLADGLDAAAQLALIDRTFEPSRVL